MTLVAATSRLNFRSARDPGVSRKNADLHEAARRNLCREAATRMGSYDRNSPTSRLVDLVVELRTVAQPAPLLGIVGEDDKGFLPDGQINQL